MMTPEIYRKNYIKDLLYQTQVVDSDLCVAHAAVRSARALGHQSPEYRAAHQNFKEKGEKLRRQWGRIMRLQAGWMENEQLSREDHILALSRLKSWFDGEPVDEFCRWTWEADEWPV